jgi:hypothetical protein
MADLGIDADHAEDQAWYSGHDALRSLPTKALRSAETDAQPLRAASAT